MIGTLRTKVVGIPKSDKIRIFNESADGLRFEIAKNQDEIPKPQGARPGEGVAN